jgi:hypothetical protein
MRAACQVWKPSVYARLRARRSRCDNRCLDAFGNSYRAAKLLEKNSIRRTPRPGYGVMLCNTRVFGSQARTAVSTASGHVGPVLRKIPGECRRSGVGLAAPLMVRNHFNHSETAALRQVARLVMPQSEDLTSPGSAKTVHAHLLLEREQVAGKRDAGSCPRLRCIVVTGSCCPQACHQGAVKSCSLAVRDGSLPIRRMFPWFR